MQQNTVQGQLILYGVYTEQLQIGWQFFQDLYQLLFQITNIQISTTQLQIYPHCDLIFYESIENQLEKIYEQFDIAITGNTKPTLKQIIQFGKQSQFYNENSIQIIFQLPHHSFFVEYKESNNYKQQQILENCFLINDKNEFSQFKNLSNNLAIFKNDKTLKIETQINQWTVLDDLNQFQFVRRAKNHPLQPMQLYSQIEGFDRSIFPQNRYKSQNLEAPTKQLTNFNFGLQNGNAELRHSQQFIPTTNTLFFNFSGQIYKAVLDLSLIEVYNQNLLFERRKYGATYNRNNDQSFRNIFITRRKNLLKQTQARINNSISNINIKQRQIELVKSELTKMRNYYTVNLFRSTKYEYLNLQNHLNLDQKLGNLLRGKYSAFYVVLGGFNDLYINQITMEKLKNFDNQQLKAERDLLYKSYIDQSIYQKIQNIINTTQSVISCHLNEIDTISSMQTLASEPEQDDIANEESYYEQGFRFCQTIGDNQKFVQKCKEYGVFLVKPQKYLYNQQNENTIQEQTLKQLRIIIYNEKIDEKEREKIQTQIILALRLVFIQDIDIVKVILNIKDSLIVYLNKFEQDKIEFIDLLQSCME